MGGSGMRRTGNGRRNRIEGEIPARESWNLEAFEGWYGNLVQWKLHKIYKDDFNEV